MMPKLKDTARIRVSTGADAYRDRQHKVIKMLGERGAMDTADVAYLLGYATSGSAYVLLQRMLNEGKIATTDGYYHLKGQSPKPQAISAKDKDNFFEGEAKFRKVRRWLRDHQDQPTDIATISRVNGYSNHTGAYTIVMEMLDKGIIRRYRAPEDRHYMWRYQYTDPDLAGIKITQGEPVKDDRSEMAREADEASTDWSEGEVPTAEPVKLEQAPQSSTPAELAEAPKPTTLVNELELASRLTEQYAKEFFWQTGSRDIRELTIWLKERMLASKE